MDKRLLLALGYAIGATIALMFTLNVFSLPSLARVSVLAGAHGGVEETLEDSLAAELLPDSIRRTGFCTMALVNGCGDFISSLDRGRLVVGDSWRMPSALV